MTSTVDDLREPDLAGRVHLQDRSVTERAVWPHGRKIIAVEQPIELLAIQRQHIARQMLGPFEALLLEPLLP
jgi:hypothetical protein